MRLLTSLAVALLPAYAFRLLWPGLSDGSGRIADGVPAFDGQSWVLVVGEAVFWSAAVLLGAVILSGGPRPVARMLRGLPHALFLLAVLAVAAYIGFVAVSLAVPGGLTFVVLGALVAIVLLAIGSSLAVRAVAAVVEADSDYRTRTQLRGRRWRTGAVYALGVVAPLLVAAKVSDIGQPNGTVMAVLASLWTSVVFTLAAAIQSMTLLRMYGWTRGSEPLPATWARRRQSRLRLAAAGFAALLLPTLLTSGFVAAGWLPVVNSGAADLQGRIVAVAWPGEYPILIGQSTIHDCLDETCTRTVQTDLGVTMLPPTGNAVVQPDGTVYAYGHAQIIVCDPQRRCEGGNALGRIDQLGSPLAAALAVGPDGNPVIAALARPDGAADSAIDGAEAVVALNLHRCHDRLCKTSDAEHVDDVRYAQRLNDSTWDRRIVALAVDATGHVTIAVREALGVRVFGAPSPEQTAALYRAVGTICDLSRCGEEYQGLIVDRPGGGAYAVRVSRGEPQALLRAGRAEEQTNATLLVCGDRICRDLQRRIPIDSSPSIVNELPPPMAEEVLPMAAPDEVWLMAVAADGRVILTRPLREDRVYVVRP